LQKNNNFITPGKSYNNMVTKFKHISGDQFFLSQYVHYALERNIPQSGLSLLAKVPQLIKNNKKNNIYIHTCNVMAHVTP